MRSYAFPAIVEHEGHVYGAFFPDLPGCGTVGDTLDELAEMAREVLTLHLSGMIEDGDAIPEPTPIERLPRDPEVNAVGAMLVTATPGPAVQVTLALSKDALRRADEAAVAYGQTRERVLTDRLEAVFAAE